MQHGTTSKAMKVKGSYDDEEEEEKKKEGRHGRQQAPPMMRPLPRGIHAGATVLSVTSQPLFSVTDITASEMCMP